MKIQHVNLYAGIAANHTYYAIWQNLVLKSQHRSKGRLFQSCYLYDLSFELLLVLVFSVVTYFHLDIMDCELCELPIFYFPVFYSEAF